MNNWCIQYNIAIQLNHSCMFQFITDNLNRLSQFIDFFLASILLTIIMVITQKQWKWIRDLCLFILGSTISGYLFSTALRAMFPQIYGLSEQLGNSMASVGVFLALVVIVERDYWKIAVEKVLKDKLNNKK